MSPSEESGMAFWFGALCALSGAGFIGMHFDSFDLGAGVFFCVISIVIGHLKDNK